MSGLAKLTSTKSYLPLRMADAAASATFGSLISGFSSYVLTSRGDGIELPFLAGERLFAPAVEEVRDVRVLFGFGAAELRLAVPRQDLGKDVGVRLFGERDRQRKAAVVGRHADVIGKRRRAARRGARNARRTGAVSASVISRARSGRKLKQMAVSLPGSTPA